MRQTTKLKKAVAVITSICLTLLTTNLTRAQTSTLSFDVIAPIVAHNPPQTAGSAGQPQTISAIITDNSGVSSATLFYRTNQSVYRPRSMTQESGSGNWMTIVDTTLGDEKIEYYIAAEDLEGNRVQKGSPEQPLVYPLSQTAAAQQAGSSVGTAGQAQVSKSSDSTSTQPNWLLIGLGVLALGLLAAGSSGSDSGSDPMPNTCCTVTFTAPNSVGSN